MNRVRKTIKVGKQFEVEQGNCMINHRISCPFDSMFTTNITEGRLYEILEQADSVKVLEGIGEASRDRIEVKMGILDFIIYQSSK